ncbi:ABC transporter permease [Nocardiopsis sp. HNM0947]|uniref:ABC transporter permease n=1 Tax=Nocardiopsis coralli TaxID=2772213 RepID=A0ABR9P3L9_9ACTN|nr:ABC transporter permease [Nocardiopsis coralli]MBE2998448.1 ABC transporter permease [Nocardiopsis coralli]
MGRHAHAVARRTRPAGFGTAGPGTGTVTRYVLRRLFQALLVLWAAYTATFALLYLLPSDPVSLMLRGGGEESFATPEQEAELRERWGFDQPPAIQYLTMLGLALTGDLGTSLTTGQPVVAALAEALPPTAQLAGAALVTAVLLGGGVAVAATYTRSPLLARFLTALPPVGVAMPTFWVGLVLVQVVSFQWGLLTALGGETSAAGLVLPALTLSLPVAALIAQVLSDGLRAELARPHTTTARAKGASRARVHLAHALSGGVLPTLTLVGVVTGELLAGAVVVETVFSRPGIGRITATAVEAQDLPLVQGVVLLAAVVFVLANLLVDLLLPLLDPRVRIGARRPGGAAA